MMELVLDDVLFFNLFLSYHLVDFLLPYSLWFHLIPHIKLERL